MEWSYCPNCGVGWRVWGEKEEPVKCWSCGFKKDQFVAIDNTPESCENHPKYRAIGKPASDCPTCWKMYKAAIDKEADATIERKHD